MPGVPDAIRCPDGSLASAPAIAPETSCAGCGYDLFGLPPDGHCPECGQPIRDTLEGYWLWQADPKWVRRLRLGVTLELVALVTIPIGKILIGTTPSLYFNAGLSLILSAAPLIVLSVFLAGLWAITTLDPRDRRHAALSVRRVARLAGGLGLAFTAGCGALVTVFWIVYDVLEVPRSGAPLSPAALFILLGTEQLGPALLIVGFAAHGLHLRRLALRMPAAPRTPRMARRVTLGVSVAATVWAMSVVWDLALTAMVMLGHFPSALSLAKLDLAAGVTKLIAGIFWAAILVMFRRRLTQALRARPAGPHA